MRVLPSLFVLEKRQAQFCPRKFQLWLSSGVHSISSCKRDIGTALRSCADGWCFPGRALTHLASCSVRACCEHGELKLSLC